MIKEAMTVSTAPFEQSPTPVSEGNLTRKHL